MILVDAGGPSVAVSMSFSSAALPSVEALLRRCLFATLSYHLIMTLL